MREINKDLSLRQRVLQLCEYYRISPNKLSQDAGYGRNFISRMTDTTSFDFLIHIYCNYEKVNIEWLLTGNGAMILPDEDKDLKKEVAELKEKLKKITEAAKV